MMLLRHRKVIQGYIILLNGRLNVSTAPGGKAGIDGTTKMEGEPGFSQQKKKNVPIILLLDEPGLFLHAMALCTWIPQRHDPYGAAIFLYVMPYAREFIILGRAPE